MARKSALLSRTMDDDTMLKGAVEAAVFNYGTPKIHKIFRG
ncbi:hypothetical protein [Mastigocladopsis repens]|nr:hypothetical protein [Mastigocladopsis repens]